MAAEAPERIRIWLTVDADLIATGEIPEYMARIHGEYAWVEIEPGQQGCAIGEGRLWHRTRWAAQNYALTIRNLRVQQLRDELAKLEGYTFGRRV